MSGLCIWQAVCVGCTRGEKSHPHSFFFPVRLISIHHLPPLFPTFSFSLTHTIGRAYVFWETALSFFFFFLLVPSSLFPSHSSFFFLSFPPLPPTPSSRFVLFATFATVFNSPALCALYSTSSSPTWNPHVQTGSSTSPVVCSHCLLFFLQEQKGYPTNKKKSALEETTILTTRPTHTTNQLKVPEKQLARTGPP